MSTPGKTTDPARINRLWKPTEKEKDEIVCGLIALPKETRPFDALWIVGAGKLLAVRQYLWQDPEYVTWWEARLMLAEALTPAKPVASEIKSRRGPRRGRRVADQL